MKAPTTLLKILFLLIVFGLQQVTMSKSLLVDTVTLTGNTLHAFNENDIITLDFSLREDKHAVGFTIAGNELAQFQKLEYQITYDSDQGKKGIVGQIDIAGLDEISRVDLLLGTCSDEGCHYHTGISAIDLQVKLLSPGEKLLHKQLSY